VTDADRFERQWKEREALRSAYPDLFERLSEILFPNDPVGINFESNTDVYEPEVGTILPRLRSVATVDDVRSVVHDEFVKWFDAENAGPESRYDAIAAEIRALRRLFPDAQALP
jgi:hypothetical protein